MVHRQMQLALPLEEFFSNNAQSKNSDGETNNIVYDAYLYNIDSIASE